jgi:uridine kinase
MAGGSHVTTIIRNAWVCIFVYIPIARDARASRRVERTAFVKGVSDARDIGARNAWVCIFIYIPIARDARASRRVERTAFVKGVSDARPSRNTSGPIGPQSDAEYYSPS